ncbi:MAG: Jag N-terminal domain-containing protein [Acidimicrobiales bacterium]
MDWIVTTARTVEEAQTRALDLLGVDDVDAEIQVVEEGKTGLFGRTKSEARVRARIKPKAPPAKEERRPSRGGGDRNRNRGGNSGSGGGNRDGGGRNRSRGGNDGGSNNKSGNRQGGNRAPKKDDASTVASGADEGRNGGSNNRGGNRDGGGRDGGGRDGGGRNRSRGGGHQRNDRDRDRGGRDNEDRVEMPVDEQRETLEAFVTGVAIGFDPSAKVVLVEEGTTLQAQVTGAELGRLVGTKASTLQSLEELARTAMHRAAAGRRYHRIQVDVDNYRGRRREALAKFATDLAGSVVDSGVSKAMEPMGAADRKLIHDAVAEIPGVETVSEGRDPRRYIVILATDASDEEA